MQFKRFTREQTNRALARFQDKLTRLEFHLSDVNAGKFGTHDKRCMAEARPARHKPLTVTAAASTPEAAVRGSLSKLRSKLDTFFGRLKPRPAKIRRALAAATRSSHPKKAAAQPRSKRAEAIAAKPAKETPAEQPRSKKAPGSVTRRKSPGAWRGPKK